MGVFGQGMKDILEKNNDFINPTKIGKQTFFVGDCLDILQHVESESIDVITTSPPYNLNQEYNLYKDSIGWNDYFNKLFKVSIQLHRVLKPDGSLFLNAGSTSKSPHLSAYIASQFNYFYLQNHIIWVKSVYVAGKTYGHFKPVNSKRYLNNCWEDIYHFTKSGNVGIDRLAVGAPFEDKSNISRWESNKKDIRCAGNVWFINYETIQNKKSKGLHPAIFPEQLPAKCIKLHGVKLGMKVLDPYCGTGTVSAVCEKMDIEGIGIDCDEKYIRYSIDRIGEVLKIKNG